MSKEKNLPAIKSELELFLQENNVNESVAKKLTEHFKPFEEQAAEWAEKAKALVITDINQVQEMEQAAIARKALVKVRTSLTAKHKELKEDSLKYGRLLDGIKNRLISLTEPIEAHLREQEEFAERQKAAQAEVLKAKRLELLSPYGVDTQFYDFGNMPEEMFEKFLNDQKLLHQAKIQQAEKEAEENKRKELQAKRTVEIAPYSAFISPGDMSDDYSIYGPELWETMLNQLKEKKDAHDNALRLENERLKKEQQAKENELEKQRNENEKAKKAAENLKKEILESRKKALFNLGFALNGNKMVFQHLSWDLDQIEQYNGTMWDGFILAQSENVAEIKIELEKEIEAAKGDKEKFTSLQNELLALQTKYNFKSKKHRKLHEEVNGLITKITDYITLKA